MIINQRRKMSACGRSSLVLSRDAVMRLQFSSAEEYMRSIAIFCLFLAMTLCLSAQTACIEGSVVDTTGAPVGIPIMAFNSGRVASMTTSNPDGHFRISINAPPAREYDLITSDDYKGYSPRAIPNMAAA